MPVLRAQLKSIIKYRWKILKYLEIKQYTFTKHLGERRNHEKMSKTFELNESRNSTYQNLWDSGKSVLRDKFMPFSAYIRKDLSINL